MPDDRTTELLMQMIDGTNRPIEAESQTVLGELDTLSKDFKTGCYFNVDEFAFGMNVDDKDPTADAVNTGSGAGVRVAQSRSSGPKVKFGRWKSATPEEIKNMAKFPLRMDEMSITRNFDRASPVLFQCCARSLSFKKASLIKRKIVGGAQLQTFLRMDFTDVLVTHVGWDDAEVIKETMRFVFRQLDVKYRRQSYDGTLMPEGSASWGFDVALKVQPNKGVS